MTQLSREEAEAELLRLMVAQAETQFEMGDIAEAHAPTAKPGDRNGNEAKVADLAMSVGMVPETLLQYRKVAHAWPPSTRVPGGASWTVHRALMAHPDRAELLRRLVAESEKGWVTKAAARAAMNGEGSFRDWDDDDDEADDTERTGETVPQKKMSTALVKMAVKARNKLAQADDMEVKSAKQQAESDRLRWEAAELTVMALDAGANVAEWAKEIDRKPNAVRQMATAWRRLNEAEKATVEVRPDFWEAFELSKLDDHEARELRAEAARRGKSVQAHAREKRAKRSLERDATPEEKVEDLKRLLRDPEAATLAFRDQEVRGPVAQAWSAAEDQRADERKAVDPDRTKADAYLTIAGRLSSARSGLRRSLRELQDAPRLPDHLIAEMLSSLDDIELTLGWLRSYLANGTSTEEALQAILAEGTAE